MEEADRRLRATFTLALNGGWCMISIYRYIPYIRMRRRYVYQ